MIHVGMMVKGYFYTMPRKYTVAWLADMLNCDRTNVYNIFQRSSIDTQLLIRLSIILHHNFFKEIAEALDMDIE